MVANQLQRIFDAVAEVVNTKGYVAMSVEDIISTAGVSRRTFYDNFKGKEEAYLRSFDAISTEMLQTVTAASVERLDFVDGTISGIRAFLEICADQPRYAYMCIVEVLAAGPVAISRRNGMMTALADLLRNGIATLPDSLDPPAAVAEIIIGGIYELVYARLLAGEANTLRSLVSDAAYAAILPYVGPEAAAEATALHRSED